MASKFRKEQFKRMQINLNMSEWFSDWELIKDINETNDLNKYINILPKSIKINVEIVSYISFIENVFKIFNTPITSFNQIKCIDISGNY